jgi:hypothetical protein
MSDNPNPNPNTSENPLWIVVPVVLLAAVAWAKRNTFYAMLAPYGLTETDGGTVVRNDYAGTYLDRGVSTVEPHYQLSMFGWGTVAVALAGVAAVLMCVQAYFGVSRWRDGGGTSAVPKIPVRAAAVAAFALTFVALLVAIGRHQVLFGGIGPLLAGAVFAVVGRYGSSAARHWRLTQAFAARADQVIGHGHPGTRRVRASAWDDRIPGPRKLVIDTGPGWQNKPAELSELNRIARQFGWLEYDWSYDPITKKLTGTAGVPAEKVRR